MMRYICRFLFMVMLLSCPTALAQTAGGLAKPQKAPTATQTEPKATPSHKPKQEAKPKVDHSKVVNHKNYQRDNARQRAWEQQREAERQRELEEQQEAERQEALQREAERQREEEERQYRAEQERLKREKWDRERRITLQHLLQNMVFVEGGTFEMGATKNQTKGASENEKPLHVVKVSSFHICQYEVTQAEWYYVMGDVPGKHRGDNLPVESVSWNDCQLFISRLNALTGMNFRLPTEAEWEYAARGGKKSKGYKYAGSNTSTDVAWFSANSGGQTHNVGTKQPNELGLYDMSGNVWEWCQDWFGAYRKEEQNNPTGPQSGGERVFRGGGWNFTDGFTRVSYRGSSAPGGAFTSIGLRLVY